MTDRAIRPSRMRLVHQRRRRAAVEQDPAVGLEAVPGDRLARACRRGRRCATDAKCGRIEERADGGRTGRGRGGHGAMVATRRAQRSRSPASTRPRPVLGRRERARPAGVEGARRLEREVQVDDERARRPGRRRGPRPSPCPAGSGRRRTSRCRWSRRGTAGTGRPRSRASRTARAAADGQRRRTAHPVERERRRRRCWAGDGASASRGRAGVGRRPRRPTRRTGAGRRTASGARRKPSRSAAGTGDWGWPRYSASRSARQRSSGGGVRRGDARGTSA